MIFMITYARGISISCGFERGYFRGPYQRVHLDGGERNFFPANKLASFYIRGKNITYSAMMDIIVQITLDGELDEVLWLCRSHYWFVWAFCTISQALVLYLV